MKVLGEGISDYIEVMVIPCNGCFGVFDLTEVS